MSAVWRKSSRSNNGGNGKSQSNSEVTAPEWASFIGAVKRGDFEKN